MNNETKQFEAATLLANRNRALGSLLTAERAIPYLTILLVLLRFRNDHELEPLHEDVQDALDSAAAPLFNQDIRQLLDWELITQRIERERLRGYRDTRRRKFRYTLTDETVAFLVWLQERFHESQLQEDIDTRDLLSDMIGCLRETVRQINRTPIASLDYEAARALFHNLTRMDAITRNVSQSLSTFNIRLLGFAAGQYDIALAKKLLVELDRFLKNFLQRVHTLRREIEPEISRLRQQRLATRWETCEQILRHEQALTGVIMRFRLPNYNAVLATLNDFYAAGGQLAQLTRRVNKSSLLVWRKLNTHLRELERRSHRLDDLRQRVSELSRFPADSVPHAWMRAIFQPPQIRCDMHEWNAYLKATPPQPVWSKHRVRQETHLWLTPPPPTGEKPTQSIEERRLAALAAWMREHGVLPQHGANVRLSAAHIAEFTDFVRIMEILRGGLLGDGRRLQRIETKVQPLEEEVTKTDGEATLTFPDLNLLFFNNTTIFD